MRTLNDALRSMGRYVAIALSPQPMLAEFTYGGTKWTTKGMVEGDIDANPAAWGYLHTLDRLPAVEAGSDSNVYLTSELLVDPALGAVDAGIDLTGDTVPEFALMLMPAYEVRFAGERGEFDPPFARVSIGGGGTSGPAFYYERTQPMTIECYPSPPVDDSAETALFNAVAVCDALELAFRRQGVGDGHQLKVPLYDYDNVPMSEPGTDRLPHDFMRVLDFAPRTLPNALDPRQVAAIADVRVAWRIGAEPREDVGIGRGTRIVASVDLAQETS